MNKETTPTPELVDHRCFICGKVAGRIAVGSLIAKDAKLICADCQEKWELLKKAAEMFREQAKKKKDFFDFGGLGDIFGGDFFKK